MDVEAFTSSSVLAYYRFSMMTSPLNHVKVLQTLLGNEIDVGVNENYGHRASVSTYEGS